MRQRSRYTSVPSKTYYTYPHESGGYWFPAYTGDIGTTPSTGEFIEDGTGKSFFHNCMHVKYTVRHAPKRGVYYNGPRGYGHDPIAYEVPVGTPSIKSLATNDFLREALQSIKPKLKASMSLPNFLLELKDIARIIPDSAQLTRYADALRGYSGNPFRKKRIPRSKRVSEAAHFAASQHLSAQFGYLPLIDDAFKLYESILSFNRKLKELKRRANRPVSGYYVKYNTYTDPEVTTHNWSNYCRFYYQDQVTVKTIIGINYQYDVSMAAIKTPFVFTKYLGFRSNPRVLWDAIPFSFVIDWFLGIGKFLEVYDEGAVPVTMNISDVWVTDVATVNRTYYMASTVTTPGASWYSGPGPQGSVEFKIYNRRKLDVNPALLMEIPPLPKVNSLTRNKVVLAGSLGVVLSKK